MSGKLVSKNVRSGLGRATPKLAIYIANRPSIQPYVNRQGLFSVLPGELAHIGFNTSNHWRKVFNVYAKFWFALSMADSRFNSNNASSWQDYRDSTLLQASSEQALFFSAPILNEKCIHIVAGKTWAQTLNLENLTWLDSHFAVNSQHRLIVCPYLDYRQLSDARIDRLVMLVKNMSL